MSRSIIEPRTALVTGAARRVGRVLALALARAGYNVALHYGRSAEQAEEVADEIERLGQRAACLGANLEDAGATAELVDRAVEALGAPGVLINSASNFNNDNATSFEPAAFDSHMAVNARAPALLANRFAAALPAGREGVIINILDQKLANLTPDFFTYTVSKIALQGVTELLAMALAPRIRVNAIAPGLTLPSDQQTPERFAALHHRTPLGKGSRPEDLAEAMLYLIGASRVTGQILYVDGGERWVRAGPRGLEDMTG